MGATKIEWSDMVWNPIRGCSMAKGSETGGCLNCYAARLAARNLPEMRSPTTGEPFARILNSGPRWTGKVELIQKAMELPFQWKRPRKIFVNSMSDLFHEALLIEDVRWVFAVMALCPQHTFQILTKRPDQMKRLLLPEFRSGMMDYAGVFCERGFGDSRRSIKWPLSNVWLGVSVENQATANERIPLLLQTPAAKRFISYEPALGPLDLEHLPSHSGIGRHLDSLSKHNDPHAAIKDSLDWVICGGESGPNARPMHPDWARSVRDQCAAAGIPFFFKQWGEWLGAMQDGSRDVEPQVLNCSEAPIRAGKRASGALLDGREWKEFPSGSLEANA